MAATGQLELRHGQRRDSAQVPDREVDLAQQQHEDDAEGEHCRARHLDDDVVEVVGGEEVGWLEAGEDEDERQPDGDGKDSGVGGVDIVYGPTEEALW